VLNPLLRGEAVDHHGESLTAAGGVALTGVAPPAVVIAALGPSMLRVAANSPTAQYLDDGPEDPARAHCPIIAKAAAAAAGRDPKSSPGSWLCLTNDMTPTRPNRHPIRDGRANS